MSTREWVTSNGAHSRSPFPRSLFASFADVTPNLRRSRWAWRAAQMTAPVVGAEDDRLRTPVSRFSPRVIFIGDRRRAWACVGVWRRIERGMPPSKRYGDHLANYRFLEVRSAGEVLAVVGGSVIQCLRENTGSITMTQAICYPHAV